MRVIREPWAVSKAVREREHIDPKPQYQRSPVWNLQRKQLLIDTIIRGYDMPKFYLRNIETPDYVYEVTDGQQRLRAIWDFAEGKFPLGEESEDLGLEGKHHADLSVDDRALFHEYQLTVTEIQDATELEVRGLFLRLQEGMPLNPAEKRNAMMGGMRDFVANLSANHKVFPLTKFNNKRFDWDDLAAHIVCLDLADGPTNIDAASLKKLYENNVGFDPEGTEGTRITRRLNFFAEVLKSEPPEMRIKWGFVDLYQLIMKMDSAYVIKGRDQDILQMYQSFELERAIVDDQADLIAPNHDEWDRDLYNYISAFQREGAKRSNLEIRRDVYVRRAHRDIPDLVPKDPNRDFDHNERVVIWRRDGGICQKCGEEILFEEMHADHIVAHAKGGLTTLDNGQTLCVPCNLMKGART